MQHTIEELKILIDYAGVVENIWLQRKLEKIVKQLKIKNNVNI